MAIETYEDAVAYWQARVNYEQRGMPADLRTLRLERMRLLLAHLGDPHERLRVVHITGTKGKGSTAAMVANVLRCAGHRTGLFTSPHLTGVEERVQIDGQPIDRAALTELMREVAAATAQVEADGEEPPTFFEIMTALGLLHFARQGVEFAVLEVGLGGRFDATNVCTPLVSVVTNIGFDHMEQLGHTLDRIAYEKAGIIKPGRPVVSGVLAAEARPVIAAVARERQSPLWQLGQDFQFAWEAGDIAAGVLPRVRLRMPPHGEPGPWLRLPLWGEHQGWNAAVALATLKVLGDEAGRPLPARALEEGLASVALPGRLEIVRRRPWIILDCAHNVASVEALLRFLEPLPPRSHCRLLFAVSRDKQVAEMLRLLALRFAEAHFTRYTSSARGADPQALADLWREAGGGPAHVHPSAVAALQAASSGLAQDDLLCVTGSVFLAGELRPLLVGTA